MTGLHQIAVSVALISWILLLSMFFIPFPYLIIISLLVLILSILSQVLWNKAQKDHYIDFK